MKIGLLVGFLIGLSACAPGGPTNEKDGIPAFDEVAFLAANIGGILADYSCQCVEDDKCSEFSSTLETGYYEQGDGVCELGEEAGVLNCTYEQRFVDVIGDIEAPGDWHKYSFKARRVLNEAATARWCRPVS